MTTLLVIALEGVMDASLALTLDTLRAAQALQARAARPVRVKLLVAGHTKTVRTGGRMRIDADCTFADVAQGRVRPDWVLVPGMGLADDAAIDARLEKRDALAAMHLLSTTKAHLAASCSAVFLLAATGLLEGRHATMTWWLAHLFRARHPGVELDETRMLVRDGRFLTAGSAYAQLDLTLAVIAEVYGAATAHLCARYLLIDQRPSQARYMVQTHVRYTDPQVVAAERWIDARLAQPIAVAELAAALALSPRTLSRRIEQAAGVSTLKFIQRRRVLQAAHLLETTALPVETIAARVGYQDGTALRKLIKRELGTTPGALRGQAEPA